MPAVVVFGVCVLVAAAAAWEAFVAWGEGLYVPLAVSAIVAAAALFSATEFASP
jgi:hypothetical protein